MILVDTSVWVDHLNVPNDGQNATMAKHLRAGEVFMNSMVIGELACGNLPNREARIAELTGMPKITELRNDVVTLSIGERNLMGRGIGFVDAHLVCAVLEREGARLWTRDRRLNRVATELGVAFVEQEDDATGDGEHLNDGP